MKPIIGSTKQNTMCWLLFTNLQNKTQFRRTAPFARSQKNVYCISILFQKVFLGWKLSLIIKRALE